MKRGLKIGLLLSLSLVGHVVLAYFTNRQESFQLFGLFAGLFIVYYFLIKENWRAIELKWLIIGSLFLRSIWLFSTPALSDDWARFVWDGRLSAAGFNPFLHLPSELIKGGLPGSNIAELGLYNALNSQQYFTVYPPVLQGMFAFSSWLFPHSIYWNVVVLKVIIFLGECGVIWLLLKLCNSLKLAPSKALIYALNPLVIAELCGNVHHEGLMLFLVLATIFCFTKLQFSKSKHSASGNNAPNMFSQKWFWFAAIFFSASVATKLLPLVFLPLLFLWMGFRKGLIFLFISASIFLLSWYPFIDPKLVLHAGSSVGLYFNHFEFNGSIYYLFSKLLVPYRYKEMIAPILGLCSGISILIYSLKNRKELNASELLKHCCIILGIYFAFAAVVHPWYLIPLIGLSIFCKIRFPIVWSVMIVSSYLTYRTIPYEVNFTQIVLEYSVVALAVLWDLQNETKTSKSLAGKGFK